jgi:hypothetical protein
MRIASILTTTLLAAGLSMSGVAIQSAYAATDATVTCGDYMKLSAADQTAAFAAVKAAMPTPTAATATTTTSAGTSAKNDNVQPMDAGAVASACQAASPSSTVMDAIEHTMSTTTTNSNSNSTTTKSK